MPPHRRVAPAVRSSAYAAIRGSRLLTFQRPLCAARIGFLQSVQKRTFGSCRSTALSGFGRRPDRVDERRECRRYLTSPRVIEEKSGKRRTQILVYSRERPVLEQRSNLVLDDVREAHTIILISRATRATRRCCNPPSSLAAIANHLRGQLDDYLGVNAARVELIVTEANLVAAAPGKRTTSLVNGLFQADITGTAMSAVNGQERTHHLKAAIPRFSHAAPRCM